MTSTAPAPSAMQDRTAPDAAEWLCTPEAMTAIAGEWSALCARSGADIFFTPDWQDCWWRHFGSVRRLHCLVLRRHGRLAAVLPFAVEPFRAGPLRLRIARLAGLGHHCVHFTPSCEAEALGDALALACAHLFDGLGCDLVSLSPVSAESALHPALAAACARHGWGLHNRAVDVHTVFDLPDCYDDWLAARGSSARKRLRRDLKRLAQDAGALPRTLTGPEDVATFIALHQRQWRANGRAGHFTDWPGTDAFLMDLASRFGGDGRLRIDALATAAGPIEATLSFVAGRTAYARLPARSLDPALVRLGLGHAGFADTVRRLIEAGCRRIEDGRGGYDYKLASGGRAVAVHRIVVARRPGCRRLGTALGWSWAVHQAAYRIWFRHVAPRGQRLLGRPPAPVPAIWVRSRL